jgi:hypothetical protein
VRPSRPVYGSADAATLRRARGWALIKALACLIIGDNGTKGLPGRKAHMGRPPAKAALLRLTRRAGDVQPRPSSGPERLGRSAIRGASIADPSTRRVLDAYPRPGYRFEVYLRQLSDPPRTRRRRRRRPVRPDTGGADESGS